MPEHRLEHRLEPEAEALLISPVQEGGEKARRDGARWYVVAAIVGLLTVILVVGFGLLWLEIQRNDLRINALYTGYKAEQDAKRAQGEPLAAPPAEDVAEDPEVVGNPEQAPAPREALIPGPIGPAGPAGRTPTAAEVGQAVAAYCAARGGCRGPQGDVGPPITAAQVAAAVSTYCDSRGNCRGPTGAVGPSGEPGEDGEDSTVPGPEGPQGPGPSDEQVSAAVAAFCGQDTQPCRGEKGPEGAPGADGTPGVGIAQTTCEGDDTNSVWRVVYTDGRIDTVPGPCRVGPAPTP